LEHGWPLAAVLSHRKIQLADHPPATPGATMVPIPSDRRAR
jgi:hypothetical protein